MPLVKDLHAREDAEDTDKFGDGADDVIDVTDPWAQFEREQEEAEQRAKVKKGTTAVVKHQSIWENKYLVMLRLWVRNSKVLKYIWNMIKKCWQSMPSTQKKVYPSIYKPGKSADFGGDDDDDDGVVGESKKSNQGGADGAEAGGEGSGGGGEMGLVPLSGGSSTKSLKANTPKGDGGKLKVKPGSATPGERPSTGDDDSDKDLENNDGGDDAEEETRLLPVDPSTLSFDKALTGGYLNRKELIALGSWFGGLFFVMMFGVTLSLAGAGPVWMGHILWVATIMFICTMVPVVKYFNTYTFDEYMWAMVCFVGLFHFIFCLTFFLTHLEADPGRVGSLWMLNFFLYYPVFLYISFEIYRWYDSGFVFREIDTNRDGRFSIWEILNYLRAAPVLIAVVILFNWQLYVWVSFTVGQVATLLLILAVVAYIYLRDWATNDFYLSPELSILGGYAINLTIFITFCVAIFSTGNPIFPASVCCFTIMFRFLTRVVHRLSLADRDAMIFFSPFVMPVYSYDSQHHDVIDEAHIILNIFYIMVTGVIWGCLMAIFYYPIDIGVALASCFLLGIAALVALAVSHMPMQLAKSACMLTSEAIVEAANAAREKFLDRKLPLNMEMRDWHGEAPPVDEEAEAEQREKKKTPLDRLKERSSLINALDVVNDVRSLKYVRNEHIEANVNVDDQDEYELRWYQQMWVDFKIFVKQTMEMVPMVNKTDDWKRHDQGTFGFKEAAQEMFIPGKGPLSFLCLDGFIYRQLAGLKDHVKYDKW